MPRLCAKPPAKSTTVPAKYFGDGSGRDSFVSFGPNQSPPRCRRSMKVAKSNKIAIGVSSPPPRFLPDGSGRDMFMQTNSSRLIVPSTGVRIGGGITASVVRRVKSAGSLLVKPLPSYKPNGHGRDTYVAVRDSSSSPSPTSFRVKPLCKKMCPRTDPPARYIPSGKRDAFHSPGLFKSPQRVRPKDEGFNYGSAHLSLSARHKHGKKGGYKRKSRLTTRAQEKHTALLAQTKIGNLRAQK